MKKLSVAEVMLLKEIEKAGLPAPVRNYKYKPTGFRFNFAWPDKKIAAVHKKMFAVVMNSGTVKNMYENSWNGTFFSEDSIKLSMKFLRRELEEAADAKR